MIRFIVLVLALSKVFGVIERTLIADCKSDITLPCSVLQNCQKYTSVMWYKFGNNSSDQSKILIKSENVIQTDSHKDSVSLDQNGSLVLRNIAPADSGIYECLIRAKAGGTNCHMRIRLKISAEFVSPDCVLTTSPVTFDSSTKFINESRPNVSIPLFREDDNTEHFFILGFVGLAVSKLVLCAVCIWVLKEIKKLRRR